VIQGQPDHIRSGSTRPDKSPCVILAGGSTEYLGKASASQHVARISIDVHIWTIEDGADTAKAIGFVVTQALLSMADQQTGFEIDSFDLVLSRFSSGLFRAMFAMKEIKNGNEIHRRVSA
jgi:hypothetical protein